MQPPLQLAAEARAKEEAIVTPVKVNTCTREKIIERVHELRLTLTVTPGEAVAGVRHHHPVGQDESDASGDSLAGRRDARLLGWLVGCLVGQTLPVCLVGCLLAWLVAWLVGWSAPADTHTTHAHMTPVCLVGQPLLTETTLTDARTHMYHASIHARPTNAPAFSLCR